MGKKSVKKQAVVEQDVEVDEDEETTEGGGLEKVLNRATVQPNWEGFSEWVQANGGPKINPKHVGVVLTAYKRYQRSDEAKEARAAAAEQAAEAKAARDAAREEKRKAAAERKAEAAERRAAREEKKTAVKATKSPAKSSKPAATKAAKATKGNSAAAAKKATPKKGRAKKAAF